MASPSERKPLVFISCGQFTDEEKLLGARVAKLVEELTSCEGYFAENENSLAGLSQNIFGALNRAVGLIAIMHHRGRVETPSGHRTRGSVWVEQETGIAAFLRTRLEKNFLSCSISKRESRGRGCGSS